ncbi:MAG: molybdenum ABC transporter ATP-binding protein [Gemmatimonadota bacterium]|jgi:molybdate transport system ATP-binding protein|nr:molybdenum ABC transporter ATP-binding protein [Gemmatimonadota bacterium]
MLEVRALWSRGTASLDVELSILDPVTALFGPSGAGKSTLLRVIAGLERPDAGRITMDGEVLFDSDEGVDLPPEKRGVGLVFQEGRLFPHLSVAGNLRYGYRLLPPEHRRFEEARIVELLKLGSLLDRRPQNLSGGEARRVAIGRALLASPRMLLLDEPLAGLDEGHRARVLALLREVRAALDIPMVYVSHSVAELLELTTRVAVLDGGRVLGQGEFFDVLGTDAVFRLAESLGLENLLEVTITGGGSAEGVTRADLGGRELILPPVDRPPGTRALVGLRPEDVILTREPVTTTSARNCIPGRVVSVTPVLGRLLVAVEAGGILRTEITPQSARELGVEEGAELYCLMKAYSFRWRHHL